MNNFFEHWYFSGTIGPSFLKSCDYKRYPDTHPLFFFFKGENFSSINWETQLGIWMECILRVRKPEKPKTVLSWPHGFEIENARPYGQIHSHSPVVKVLWKHPCNVQIPSTHTTLLPGPTSTLYFYSSVYSPHELRVISHISNFY